MKKEFSIFTIAFVVSSTFTTTRAQTNEYLDINNVKARINANHYLFYDSDNMVGSYEFPKNSGKKSIFSARLVMMGKDVNGLLKGDITPIYNDSSHQAGPIMDSQHYASEGPNWDKVWKISCTEIQLFKDWYQAGIDDSINGTNTQSTNFPGYQIPLSILNWPAHGDTNKGQAYYLAPYVDNNLDGQYNPSNGDYPKIKGSQAIFFIYNDERSFKLNLSSRIEVQGMAYAFNQPNDSALNNTIFLNYKIINRSAFTLADTYLGLDVDFDIGNPSDDRIGCDVQRSAFYAYNGDGFDEQSGPLLGYESQLATQSVVILSGPPINSDFLDNPFTSNVQDALDSNGVPYSTMGFGFGDGIVDNEQYGMENFMTYGVSSSTTGSPTNATEHYNYLRSHWRDGSSLTYGGNGYGGSIECKYFSPHDSDPLFWGTAGIITTPTSWATNLSHDTRGFGSSGPFTLHAGSTIEVDMALVSGIDYSASGNFSPVVIVQERIDSIRSYYKNGLVTGPCNSGPHTSIIEPEKIKEHSIKISPNPFNHEVTINYSLTKHSAVLEIYNLIGEKVRSQTITTDLTHIKLDKQPSGIYFITIIDNHKRITSKVIKR